MPLKDADKMETNPDHDQIADLVKKSVGMR